MFIRALIALFRSLPRRKGCTHSDSSRGREQPDEEEVCHHGRTVGQREPEGPRVPAHGVAGPGVPSRQGVLHAAGHLGEVWAAHQPQVELLVLQI